MAEVSKEEQMELAIKAFNQGQFQSKTSCAQAFDVLGPRNHPGEMELHHVQDAQMG